VLVMNSDLFFHPALVARLLDQGGDALLYDSGSGDEEEQMKVRVSQGRLVEMSFSGCTATVSQRNAQYLSGRNGTVTLNGKIGVPAFFARIVGPDANGVQVALAFSSERKFYYLSKEVRQGIGGLLSQVGTAPSAAVAVMR